ncbi:MAG: hypothetical protein RLY16_1980 [Bacteroidota bacterium]
MKALIIEDEKLIARELVAKLAEAAPDVEVLDCVTSVKTSTRWLMENGTPDFIFADIQLSDGISFDIFERFQLQCPIIFTTAYDEYALRAFKVNGVDYLLKPLDTTDLTNAVEKVRKLLQSENKYPLELQSLVEMIRNPTQHAPTFKEKFVVKQRNNWIPIAVKEIAAFYRENLIYLLTFKGEKYVLDFLTLDEIEELLNPKYFFRANRQSILHIDAIATIRQADNQKLEVHLKAPLKNSQDISREKAPAFKKWLDA